MKKIIQSICLVMALFFVTITKAQLSGSYPVPGTCTSIAAAISSLNTLGVSGPVTIDIAAGYTEVAPVGGYTLNTITGASAANTIIFQKSGAGANPLITAYAGGVATPVSAIQDGVWRLVGADYITINGIDISDPNTTNPSTMEFGYGFFKASATNGCQNNTIMNCHIILNRVNNDAGAGPAIDGSRGIDMVSAGPTHTTVLAATSAAGANSNNKIYSNIIENCNYGIAVIGYAAATPFTNADTGNDIGGTSSATGNTIINYGGGGTTSPAAGIRTLAQYAFNVRYNLINNNNGGGINHTQDLRGIYLNTAASTNATVNSNTVTLNGGGTTNQVTAIQNSSGGTPTTNSIIINNNLITNCTNSLATSGAFYGLYNSVAPSYLSISGNTLSNNSTNATSGSYYNIYNSGAVTTTIDINNNVIGLGTFSATATSLEMSGVYNTAGTNASILNVLSNTLQSANYIGTAGTSAIELIYNTGRRGSTNMNNNNFNNITVKTTNYIYLIYNSSITRTTTANNNVITTGFTNAGTGGAFVTCYYNGGNPGTGTSNINGNNFSNISLAGPSTFYGIDQETMTNSQVEIINNNVLSNITGLTTTMNPIYFSYGDVGSSVSGNTVTGYTGANIFGITIGSSSSNSLVISGNVLGSYTAVASAGQAVGIFHSSGTISNISKNKIFDIAATGNTNVVGGIYISGGTTVNIYNNLVGDLRTPSTGGIPISAIYVGGATTANVFYNTVNLAGTSSGANFGSIALFASTSPVLNLRNNILVNNAVPTGTGSAYAYFRSSTTLTSYSVSSNNNLFYAGTPSANNLLFYDGTNSIQTLSAYKVLASTRDALSVTENPTFVSTSGTNPNFLNINTSIPTQIESGGIPVPSITDDYVGTTRNVTTPDIGAWEGTYLTSSCSATPPVNLVTASIGTICPNANVSLSIGSYTLTGLTYQWMASTTSSTSGFAAIPSATTDVYNATGVSATTWYQVAVTCAATTNSSSSLPVQVSLGSPVTSNAIASQTTICSGQNVNLSLSGSYSGVAYQWMASTTASNSGYSAISNATLSTAAISNVLSPTWYQAVISCSANTTFSATTAPSFVAFLAAPVYTTTPFIENFDATWENRCDLKNVPKAAYWSDSPTTGNNSWRRQDDGASAVWTSAGTGINSPLSGTGCANFHSYYANHTSGSMSLFLNMTSAAPNYSLAFYYQNVSGVDSLEIFLSTNGGTSSTKIGSYVGSPTWAKKIINLGPVNSSSCVITFSASSDYGADDIGIDSLEVKTCPNVVPVVTSSAVCPGGTSTISVSGATTYSWSTSSTSTSISVTPASNSIYSVTGSNGLCAVTKTVGVNINPTPTLNITGSSGICTGQNATLNVSGASTYTWDSGSNSTQIVSTPVSNTIYSVSGTSSLGCVGTNTQLVTVALTLSISIIGTPTVCLGQSVLLTGNGGVTYAWNSGATTTTIAPSPTSNTSYTVIGSSGSCSNTAIVTVTVNSTPTIAVSGTSIICSGNSTTLTAGGGVTYSWSTASANASISVSPLTNTTYTVTGFNSFGCSTSVTTAVVSNTLPIITVAQTATGVCLTSATTLTASGASSYTWTGGPINAFYTVTPTSSTVYTVTGTNAAGCISSKTVGVTSYSLPVFSIAPAATATVCSLSPVTFTASGASTYTWSGVAAPGASVSYTPTAYTVYTVTGTSSQSCVASATVGVTTNTLPIIAITPPSATVCSQSAAGFTASGASTYNWNNTYFTAIFSAAPVSNSTYTLTGSSSQGCSKTLTVGVVALPLPTLVVSPALSTLCVNSTAIYTVSGALSYTWANSTNATTIALTPTNNSVYSVTGSDINGCTSVGSAVIITNPLPILTVSPVTATVCPNTAVNFTASGANTYSWSNGVITASAIITPSVSGIYTVTGVGANSCAGTQTVALTTKTVPVISITPSSSSVCLNAIGTFSANGAVSYTWSSGTQGSGISVSPSVTTVYTVTGKNGIGCTSTATVNLNIWQLPVINISTNATTVCAKELITLTASGASTYTWYPFNVTGATFTNNPINTIPYSVVAVDANGCSNSDTLIVYVDKCTGIKNNSALNTRISLYPNPSTGFINANFGFEGSKEIVVLNSVGALVMKAFTEELSTTVDLSGYAKGVYFIRVQTNGDSVNYKIIIQ